MKNLMSTQTTQVKISLKDFKKQMMNGAIGHNISNDTADCYVSQVKKVVLLFCTSEKEFFAYTPKDIATLINLMVSEGAEKMKFNCGTFKAMITALNCYKNYLNYKHYGIIVVGKKSWKLVPKAKVCNNNCKSFLWKLLNALGLLKYL